MNYCAIWVLEIFKLKLYNCLLDVNASRWHSYLKSLEVDVASVWRSAGRLTGGHPQRTRHPLTVLNGTVYSDATNMCVCAVSYTHLDVYKRQDK